MEKVIIIGCGGYAKIAIDILVSGGQYEIEGIVDRVYSKKSIDGIRVLCGDEGLPDLIKSGIKKAVFAVGCISPATNQARKEKYERIKKLGFGMINVIQEHAYVSKTAKIGEGNIIIGHCYIGPNVKIGSGAIMHPFASVEHDSAIGDFVQLSQGAKIAGGVTVGDLSFVGMGASVIQGISVPENTFIKSGSVYY